MSWPASPHERGWRDARIGINTYCAGRMRAEIMRERGDICRNALHLRSHWPRKLAIAPTWSIQAGRRTFRLRCSNGRF